MAKFNHQQKYKVKGSRWKLCASRGIIASQVEEIRKVLTESKYKRTSDKKAKKVRARGEVLTNEFDCSRIVKHYMFSHRLRNL